jgi:hypothetical protein
MGEAKRRREAGERVSWCRTCTYCCVLPDIATLDKPMYRACRHIADRGCGIFGKPERPAACTAYECAYLSARLAGSAERHQIPHPLDAGAYFHRDPVERLYVLFVDPDRAELWKRTAVADYLRARVAEGFELLVIDRGHRMAVTTPFLYEEVLKRDYVVFAEEQGRRPDIESFAEFEGAR